MGVAILSPDPQLRWGGSGPGLSRYPFAYCPGFLLPDQRWFYSPDGPVHSAAVNQLLTNV